MIGLPVVLYLFYKLIFNPDQKIDMEILSTDVNELIKQMAIVQEKIIELEEKITQLEKKCLLNRGEKEKKVILWIINS
ncbi:MAG: hypothetical protein ACFFD4_34525 [Candidatus Odinarchaeota archaeon]